MAALLTGQGVSQIAEEYELPKQTVSDWMSSLSADEIGRVRTKKAERITGLLLEYVNQNLETLAAQSRIAGSPEYVKAQPASELATLHGVIADKTIRILAALEPTD